MVKSYVRARSAKEHRERVVPQKFLVASDVLVSYKQVNARGAGKYTNAADYSLFGLKEGKEASCWH